MTKHPLLLEVDLLRGLETLLARGPVAILTSSSPDELAALLTREARTFHTVEGDEARARLAAAEAEARARVEDAGEAQALARAQDARAAVALHAAAAAVSAADARAVLDRVTLLEPSENRQNSGRVPPGAAVVTLADDGWSLLDDEVARRAARDAFLGR